MSADDLMFYHSGPIKAATTTVFMPDYTVISVGKENMYGHGMDKNGDLIVHSDGKTVSIECSK